MSQTVFDLMLIAFWIAQLVVWSITIWGWIRWAKQKERRIALPGPSFIGFLFASISALLAISTLLHPRFVAGFDTYDSTLMMKIYKYGALLSAAGMILAIIGIWRRGPLRWYAPICGLGTFVFWFVAATFE
jgi:small-conductance mechanosensitive channel